MTMYWRRFNGSAVQRFLTAVEFPLAYDADTIVFAPDMKVHVLDRSLVVDRAHRDGAYLTARVIFDPVFREGRYTGLSRAGTLKIIFDLVGEHTDEVYSRDNVIATEGAR